MNKGQDNNILLWIKDKITTYYYEYNNRWIKDKITTYDYE